MEGSSSVIYQINLVSAFISGRGLGVDPALFKGIGDKRGKQILKLYILKLYIDHCWLQFHLFNLSRNICWGLKYCFDFLVIL